MGLEYIRNDRKYKQLSYGERGKIEAYLTLKYSISKISEMMKRAKSTISEEIKKGKYNGKYTAHIAQSRAERRRKESHKHSKWRNIKLLHFIEKRLQKKWSPEIISVEWKKNTGETFSHTSIYAVIREHRPEWQKWLIHKSKSKERRTSVVKIQKREGIEKRPVIVDSRKRFGDWEVDTVLRPFKSEVQRRLYFGQQR